MGGAVAPWRIEAAFRSSKAKRVLEQRRRRQIRLSSGCPFDTSARDPSRRPSNCWLEDRVPWLRVGNDVVTSARGRRTPRGLGSCLRSSELPPHSRRRNCAHRPAKLVSAQKAEARMARRCCQARKGSIPQRHLGLAPVAKRPFHGYGLELIRALSRVVPRILSACNTLVLANPLPYLTAFATLTLAHGIHARFTFAYACIPDLAGWYNAGVKLSFACYLLIACSSLLATAINPSFRLLIFGRILYNCCSSATWSGTSFCSSSDSPVAT